MNMPIRARKRADLLSLAGAAVAGVAAGAWFADAVRPVVVPVFATGMLAHAVGMTARHRLERQGGSLPAIWQWLYILCWIGIVAIAGWGAWRWIEGVH